MKKIFVALVLSLFLISTPLVVSLAGVDSQGLSELSLQISQLKTMSQFERTELQEMIQKYLNENKNAINVDIIKEIINNGEYRFAEAVEYELQARINGLETEVRERVRARLNKRNNQQVTGLAAKCLRFGVAGEELAQELNLRERESNQALQEALQNILHIRLHARLGAHSENGDCDCEDCLQLRQQLQEMNFSDCAECVQIRERLRDGSCCDNNDCNGDQKQVKEQKGSGPGESKGSEQKSNPGNSNPGSSQAKK